MELFYINKKNKKIDLDITYHAKLRFKERYNKVFIKKQIHDMEEVETTIEKWWKTAVPKINRGRKLQTRSKRHGLDTLYFSTSSFMFVVQNSVIVTIELGAKDNRHLNKKNIFNHASLIKERQINRKEI
jgi:hypothetical protein